MYKVSYENNVNEFRNDNCIVEEEEKNKVSIYSQTLDPCCMQLLLKYIYVP
jgi:hypothetical protein